MIAAYRLRERLVGFEFFLWLVMVKAAGATEIVLDPSNPKTKNLWRPGSVAEKFSSVVVPGAALAGLPHRIDQHEGGLNATPNQIVAWSRAGNTFDRMTSVKPPAKCDYTVTLRKNRDGAVNRNSNEEAWRTFAKEIGAVVIEDYCDKPIHLHDRFALYAGAKMNFGVCNGPIFLISLTPYPVMQFVNSESARNAEARWEVFPGQKYPWMLPHQNLIWEEDTLDNLRRNFDALQLDAEPAELGRLSRKPYRQLRDSISEGGFETRRGKR